MKKLSLLLVVLLAAGSAGLYGQMAIGTNFSVSGEATATAGYDLDDEQFGFKNEAKSNIKIVFEEIKDEKLVQTDGLVPKQTVDNSEKVGMSGWVGSIELKDFRIIIDSDEEDSTEYRHALGKPTSDAADWRTRTGLYIEEPTIVAKLKNGPLFLQIYDAPDNKVDMVLPVENDSDELPNFDECFFLGMMWEKSGKNTGEYHCYKTGGDNAAESNDADHWEGDVGIDLGGKGITVGYTTPDLHVAFGITSDEPYDSESEDGKDDDAKTYWNEKADPKAGSIVASGDISVTIVEGTKIELGVVQGLRNSNDSDVNSDDTGVGAKLAIKAGDISLEAAADVHLYGDHDIPDATEDYDYELGAKAKVALTPDSSLDVNFIHSSREEVATDVEVILDDKSGLVQDLDMSLTWGLFDIVGGDDRDHLNPADTHNDEMDMMLKADFAYTIEAMGGKLKPGTAVTINQIDQENSPVELELRAVLTEAIPATEFGLKWKTDRLLDVEKSDGTTDEAKSGIVTLWTKIKY